MHFYCQMSREQKAIFLTLVIACVVRLAAAALIPDQSAMFPDAASYKRAAMNLWAGRGLENIYIMPLYPIIVAMVGAGWGQTLFDISASVLSVWLVYVIAKALFSDSLVALVAALMAALYPPFIFFSVLELSEPLFIMLLLAAFACWYRGHFAMAAAFAVLSILTRPVLDLAAPVLVVYFSAVIHRLGAGRTLRNLAVYGLIYAGLMTPWWIYNYRTYGQFVRLNLNYGIGLYAGNNPLNITGGGDQGVDFDYSVFSGITDPVARDREFRERAYAYIAEKPTRFLEMSFVKVARMWRLWPYNKGYAKPALIIGSLVTFVPILFFSLLYLVVWGRSEIRRVFPMLFLAAYLSAVVAVMVGTIRYRLPLEPFMIVLSAAAIVRLAISWQPVARARGLFAGASREAG